MGPRGRLRPAARALSAGAAAVAESFIYTAPTVLRTDRPEVVDPEVSLLSDNKGLYDALNNELPQDDKKAAVEMPIIEGILRKHGKHAKQRKGHLNY